MRVLLAGYLLGQGGVQSHLRWLAKALGEANIETLAISLGNQPPTAEELADLQPFKMGKTQFICCTPYSNSNHYWHRSKFQRFSEITALIRQFDPDVYLAAGTGWNLFLPVLLTGRKVRRIFHEVMSGVAGDWRDSRWAVRWGFDEVVGQSPIVAQTFARSFGWTQAIASLPAIPEPLEVTARLPQPIAKPIQPGTVKAALFSRLVPHKQAFWLVQQWDSLKHLLGELHIHGSGPEEALIQNYIAAHGLGDRIRCFGRYPDGQDYVDLLSQYDLTLLPTIGAEGAPLVLLESMACGVPFVAYGVGGIPDYAVDNPNVLVVPPQPQAFIAGVQLMVERLQAGKIDLIQLQQFYLQRYSYNTLKQAWLSYLVSQ